MFNGNQVSTTIMGRYVVRVFADQEENGATEPGTVIRPLSTQLSFYEDSADDAEKKLQRDVLSGKLPSGRVYQICPSASLEPIRSCAVSKDGSAYRVFLDPAEGPYSELRRIRLPRPQPQQPQPAAMDAAAPDH